MKFVVGLVALMLGVSSAEAAGTADRTGVAATWRAATIALPANATGALPVFGRWREAGVQSAVRAIPGSRKVPAILYFHGCDGIGVEEESARIAYMEVGYAVFFPDSFARVGRRSNCRTDTFSTSSAPEAHAYRIEEIAYARKQLRAIPWVDQDRVFAIGFSEGGMALAGYDGNDFTGVIITGWHCDGRGRYQGLRTPDEIPVLTIIAADDPWYEAKKGRHCGLYFNGRKNARSLVLQNNGHAIMNSVNLEHALQAKQAILEFLMSR